MTVEKFGNISELVLETSVEICRCPDIRKYCFYPHFSPLCVYLPYNKPYAEVVVVGGYLRVSADQSDEVHGEINVENEEDCGTNCLELF